MDYLFNTVIREVPPDYEIVRYYVIDNRLIYVAVHKRGQYYLYWIESDHLDEIVFDSESCGDIECYVLDSCKPFNSLKTSLIQIEEFEGYLVEIHTVSGDCSIKKKRERTDRTPITRYFSDFEKPLF